MSEEWRDVLGWPAYQVSDWGRVRKFLARGRMRYPAVQQGSGGYQIVKLCRGGEARSFRVHRLVLAAFVGPAPAGHQGCHNNGDPSDNRLDNLRWDTPAGNALDKKAHGTQPHNRGETNPNVKLSESDARAIREYPRYRGSVADLVSKYNISRPTVEAIRYGRLWRHSN